MSERLDRAQQLLETANIPSQDEINDHKWRLELDMFTELQDMVNNTWLSPEEAEQALHDYRQSLWGTEVS